MLCLTGVGSGQDIYFRKDRLDFSISTGFTGLTGTGSGYLMVVLDIWVGDGRFQVVLDCSVDDEDVEILPLDFVGVGSGNWAGGIKTYSTLGKSLSLTFVNRVMTSPFPLTIFSFQNSFPSIITLLVYFFLEQLLLLLPLACAMMQKAIAMAIFLIYQILQSNFNTIDLKYDLELYLKIGQLNSYLQKLTNMSMHLNIQSFDAQILQDQLLAVLERSPHTNKFIHHRVGEIVVEIMSTPIIQKLQTKIEQQKRQIVQLIEKDTELRQLHKRQSQQFKSRMKNVLMKNRQLQKSANTINHMQEQLNQIRIEKESSDLKIKQLREKIISLQKQAEQKKTQIKEVTQNTANLGQKLQISFQQLKNKQNQIAIMKEQNERLKKNSKAIKYNQIQMRKQCENLSKQNQQLLKEILVMKENFKYQALSRQNERKGVNVKLKQLNRQHLHELKMKKKLGSVAKIIVNMKQEHFRLKQDVENQLKRVKENTIQSYYEFMDELGLKMGKQLEFLMLKMTSKQTEIKIYKEELRIKEEIIGEIEKAAWKQIQGNAALRSELKMKRTQAETLKKQLMRNFEEQQIKMLSLEKTYRDILIEQSHHLY